MDDDSEITSSYNDVIVFDDSEAEPIVADAPGYSEVITFSDDEAEVITAGRPTYTDTIVFDENEVEPIIGAVPGRLGPSPTIAFDQQSSGSEARPTAGPYHQVIQFDDAEGLVVLGRRRPSATPPGGGYNSVLHQTAQQAQPAQPAVTRTTGPEDRPSWWPPSTGISFELSDAWQLPPPSDIQTELPLPQTQVLSWLREHRSEIIAAETRWRVDRRAIAAAIAWEALVNVRTVSVRAVGPGKVHTEATVVQEVEASGLLPARSAAERRALLRRPGPSITYIAAIMSAKAAIAEAFGFSIRNRVDILTNEYQGRSLRQWTDHLANKRDTTLVGENSMSTWAVRYQAYLELGVGAP
jgi:hypothetical protein